MSVQKLAKSFKSLPLSTIARSRARDYSIYLGKDAPESLRHIAELASAQIRPAKRPAMDVSGLTVEELTTAVHDEAALLAAEAHHSTAMGRINQRLDRQAVDEVNAAAPLVAAKAVDEFSKAAKKYVAAVKKLPSGIIRPELLLKQGKVAQDAYYAAVSARAVMDDAVDFMATMSPPDGELVTVVTLVCKPETYQAYQSVINTHKEAKGKEAFNDRLGTIYLAIARSGIEFSLAPPQGAFERERVLLAAGSEEAPSNPFHGKFDTSTPVRTL